MGFLHNSVGREPACNAGGLGTVPGLGRSTEEGIGYALWKSPTWEQKHKALRASLVAQMAKNLPATEGDTGGRFDPWVGKITWRRVWQPTPVFLPGKSHGQRSLVGYSPWAHTDSDMTEHASTHTWAWGRRNGTDLLGSKDCTQFVPCWESQE